MMLNIEQKRKNGEPKRIEHIERNIMTKFYKETAKNIKKTRRNILKQVENIEEIK